MQVRNDNVADSACDYEETRPAIRGFPKERIGRI